MDDWTFTVTLEGEGRKVWDSGDGDELAAPDEDDTEGTDANGT